MKHLIIIGAGGMGRTMYDMARESIGYGTQYDIRGFIDDNTSALNNFAFFHFYRTKRFIDVFFFSQEKYYTNSSINN